MNNNARMLINSMDATAIYFSKDHNLLSLAIDTKNTKYKIIYAGVDNGSILKIVLNHHDQKPILVQKIILFNNLPVTHLKINYK